MHSVSSWQRCTFMSIFIIKNILNTNSDSVRITVNKQRTFKWLSIDRILSHIVRMWWAMTCVMPTQQTKCTITLTRHLFTTFMRARFIGLVNHTTKNPLHCCWVFFWILTKSTNNKLFISELFVLVRIFSEFITITTIKKIHVRQQPTKCFKWIKVCIRIVLGWCQPTLAAYTCSSIASICQTSRDFRFDFMLLHILLNCHLGFNSPPTGNSKQIDRQLDTETLIKKYAQNTLIVWWWLMVIPHYNGTVHVVDFLHVTIGCRTCCAHLFRVSIFKQCGRWRSNRNQSGFTLIRLEHHVVATIYQLLHGCTIFGRRVGETVCRPDFVVCATSIEQCCIWWWRRNTDILFAEFVAHIVMHSERVTAIDIQFGIQALEQNLHA